MESFKIALLQMNPADDDQTANLLKGEEFCIKAKEMGADLALFPEMWNIGYTTYHPETEVDDYDPFNPEHPELIQNWKQKAINHNDRFIRHYSSLARRLNMAIAITYLEKYPGNPRNSMSLIDKNGKLILTYAKVHTCDFALEAHCTPGDDFEVCKLETEHGEITIGAMICYDREFPESARILMLKGAELILVPNACPFTPLRKAQLQTRAFENMVGIAMTNYAAPKNNGHSIAFDGVAYQDSGDEHDLLLVEAGEKEGIYIADFNIKRLREYRAHEAWGNAFRKPNKYKLLIDTQVNEPFIREAARR